MNRRDFLRTGITLTAGAAVLPFFPAGVQSIVLPEAFPRRKLGQTGEMISIIGFGGILVKNERQKEANNRVAQAFDRGINYFDVAPTYGDAEERLGPALEPYRKRCFLACKTKERTRPGAERELHDSLKKLKTEVFDLYQLHALTTEEDVKRAFGPGGAMELLVKAREQGKVRYLGFSAHSEEAALMAMERFEFDTILFPINFVCWFQGDFGPRVVAEAKKRKMGILALKALALTRGSTGQRAQYEKLWYVPVENPQLQDLALRFTLSQGTTSAIPPAEAQFFWRALEIARNPTPLTPEEEKTVAERSQGILPLFTSV
ncbi:MAG: aldo/keto reductase [Fidelibacterota bacterium]